MPLTEGLNYQSILSLTAPPSLLPAPGYARCGPHASSIVATQRCRSWDPTPDLPDQSQHFNTIPRGSTHIPLGTTARTDLSKLLCVLESPGGGVVNADSEASRQESMSQWAFVSGLGCAFSLICVTRHLREAVPQKYWVLP